MSIQLPPLPETWSTTRVDRVASVNARIGWKALTADEYQLDGYAFLSTPNIKTQEIDFKNVNFITEERYEESPELKLQKGDVLLAKDGNTLGIVNIVRFLPRSATVNGSIAVIRPFGIDPTFLKYLLESQFIQATINQLKGGMGVPHLFQWDIKRLPAPLPPRQEQRRIADFLDVETARIDSLAAARKKMASLLALKRERLIESNLQLDSAIQEAKVTPLKYLAAEVTVGIVITPAKWYVTNGGVPALRGTNVRPGRISGANLVKISDAGHLENRKSRLRSGDLVIVRTGQAGAAAVVPSALDGANCIDLIIIRPGPALSPRYLEYVLNSGYARRHVEEYSTGSIQAHFNVGAMKQIPIPSIPRKYQDRLVAAIDDAVARIDRLSERIQDQATLLMERRQALISAAVMGQFDVSTASGRGVTE
ncbi:restriction endonuclease subunit S [Actinomadura geliboluensis]|uniref:restriction endonuclease subunit S n=1 Tax=Actinomadura geliboluensis TaxID=882440 RepID=UPI00371AC7C9